MRKKHTLRHINISSFNYHTKYTNIRVHIPHIINTTIPIYITANYRPLFPAPFLSQPTSHHPCHNSDITLLSLPPSPDLSLTWPKVNLIIFFLPALFFLVIIVLWSIKPIYMYNVIKYIMYEYTILLHVVCIHYIQRVYIYIYT